MSVIKFIDLFAGIGGFHYGLIHSCQKSTGRVPCNGNCRCGNQSSELNTIPVCCNSSRQSPETSEHIPNPENTDQRCTKSFSCVYANEWDKYANAVYRRHYGECDTRDIRTVDTSEIPDHDLLCAGFPCQSFSIAGKRLGFEDTRGTMFFEIARIIRDKRPRYFLLENVKGLLSHEEGRTFETIIKTLDELGYDLQWQVLNSKNFGVPQNRERVFIIGHLRGTARPQIFPIGESSSHDTEKSVRETQNASTLQAHYNEWHGGNTYIGVINKGEFKQTKDESLCIDRNYGKGPDNHGQRTIIRSDLKVRRLTPVECERLQGFPDNWTKYGFKGELISDTQRYKMCGNAVTTKVITEIGKRLLMTL